MDKLLQVGGFFYCQEDLDNFYRDKKIQFSLILEYVYKFSRQFDVCMVQIKSTDSCSDKTSHYDIWKSYYSRCFKNNHQTVCTFLENVYQKSLNWIHETYDKQDADEENKPCQNCKQSFEFLQEKLSAHDQTGSNYDSDTDLLFTHLDYMKKIQEEYMQKFAKKSESAVVSEQQQQQPSECSHCAVWQNAF